MAEEICIWAVSDEKSGHQNQTEGLIQALSQYRKIKLIRMPIVSRFKALAMIFTKKCGKLNQKPADLIIGTGHQTHLSLFAYKRCFGGKVVTMMSPSLPLKLFDLCFIPRHDHPKKVNNVIETLGAINRVIPSSSQLLDKGLILIGGSSKHFSWSSSEVLQQIELLINKNKEIQWTLASSRRTPPDFYAMFKKVLPDIQYILPEETRAEWLPKKMQETGNIWVTEDSISMIYEALTSGAITGILRLPIPKPTRVNKEVSRLVSEGIVQTISSINGNKQQSKLYEADRCATLLIQKFNY